MVFKHNRLFGEAGMYLSRNQYGKILKYIYINSSEKILAQEDRRTL